MSNTNNKETVYAAALRFAQEHLNTQADITITFYQLYILLTTTETNDFKAIDLRNQMFVFLSEEEIAQANAEVKTISLPA